MGNPDANALQSCQIQFLHDSVTKLATYHALLGPEIYLWMDTLCCPVKPRDARKQAIRKMRDTYSKAAW